MVETTELLAVGIALLGVILGTWIQLHNINKKLDRLLTGGRGK